MVLFLKNLIFTILVPGTVAVYVPLRIAAAGWAGWPAWSARVFAGALFVVIGAAGYLWCVWEFAVTGRGTPAPIDAPKRLVVRGLYRYVRNPIYLSVLLLVLGWAVLFASGALVLYAIGLGLAMHGFVILVEEPTLRRNFGESYERYCREVRRWLPGRGSA